MQIQRIVVDNFCSIQHADVEPSKFNVFVGQNNHGKTNFFEAVQWFYTGRGEIADIRFGRRGQEAVSVELFLTDVQDGLSKMKNERNRASVANVIDGQDSIRIRRTSDNGGKIRHIYDDKANGWRDKNPAGFDTAFNDFLPVFEYVDTDTRLADVSKFGRATPISGMLSGVLTAILEKSQKYQEFKQTFSELFESDESEVRIELDRVSKRVQHYVNKQFPDCTSVHFEVKPPEFDELLKSFTTSVDDGIETEASEKGDGMQRAVMLAILQAYADARKEGEALGKTFLFFIDEAELHLHPTAQRSLKNALQDLAKQGDQVFINTHSSVLVAEEDNEQKIFKVEKTDGRSNICEISSQEMPPIIYELLGGSPADLLLPRNFLIVEGRSEFEFLKQVINRHYPDKPSIQIVYAESGDEEQRRSMNALNKLFVPLHGTPVYKDRAVIFCDSPSPSHLRDFNNFLAAYRTLVQAGQIRVSPQKSLEEYYPEPWRKTSAEVADLRRQRGVKVELAKTVGYTIIKEVFEREMEALYLALDRCWNCAHV